MGVDAECFNFIDIEDENKQKTGIGKRTIEHPGSQLNYPKK